MDDMSSLDNNTVLIVVMAAIALVGLIGALKPTILRRR